MNSGETSGPMKRAAAWAVTHKELLAMVFSATLAVVTVAGWYYGFGFALQQHEERLQKVEGAAEVVVGNGKDAGIAEAMRAQAAEMERMRETLGDIRSTQTAMRDTQVQLLQEVSSMKARIDR